MPNFSVYEHNNSPEIIKFRFEMENPVNTYDQFDVDLLIDGVYWESFSFVPTISDLSFIAKVNPIYMATSYSAEGWYLLNGVWTQISTVQANTIKAPPAVINKSSSTDTSITINWNTPLGNLDNDHWVIYTDEADTAWDNWKEATQQYFVGNQTTVSGLQVDTSYRFSISSYGSSQTGSNTDWSQDYIFSTSSARPSNFAWHTSKVSGEPFQLTANEWNDLLGKINDFRQYKGLSNYSFTNAVTGNSFTATMFNQARNAINDMSPPTAVPSTKSSNDELYASYLSGLVESLNSIQ